MIVIITKIRKSLKAIKRFHLIQNHLCVTTALMRVYMGEILCSRSNHTTEKRPKRIHSARS